MHWALLLLLLGACDAVVTLRSGKYCFEGCDLTLSYVDFNDTDAVLSKKIRTCRSVLRATSLYLCAEEYCVETGRDEWLRDSNETCLRLNQALPPYSIVKHYTPEDVAGIRRLQAKEGMWNSKSPPVGEVVLPDQAFFERAFKTLDYAFFEVNIHWVYGMAMYLFWAIVITIGMCTRLTHLIQNLHRREWQPVPSSDLEAEDAGISKYHADSSKPYALLKRYIIFPATFGYSCSQNVGWCTIPPRIQTLTIFSFVFLNTLLCCISYPVFSENLYWPLVSTQLWRYISDRTGVISLANFPLVWLFGTRNNLLMWLTGWGFGCYNNFHRWVARVATVQAVVHSIGYTEMIFERGDWSLFMKYWGKHYFWNGEIATILMCAICAFSVYGLRRSHYEIFLVTHIILSIIVLLTTFYHVEIFNGEWNIFIWPCLLIWILDRAIRTIRILAFNWRFWNTRATATYDISSNLIRLEIPYEKSLLRPRPGTYYYIYVLNNLFFTHQNHPFTLAYFSNKDSSDATTPLTPLHPSPRRTESISSSESDSLLLSSSNDLSSLVFLIRPYDGFTSRLKQHALSSPKPLRVLVEGPYGETNDLHTFPNILFVVGGTGIAVPLSYLERLLSEDSKVRSVHIVWAVREHAFLANILYHDLKALNVLKDDRLKLTAHVTQDDEFKDDVLQVGKNPKWTIIKAGRPDVHSAVDEAAREAGKQSLAVVACGPAKMADNVRQACVRAISKGHREIEYFEESFKW